MSLILIILFFSQLAQLLVDLKKELGDAPFMPKAKVYDLFYGLSFDTVHVLLDQRLLHL